MIPDPIEQGLARGWKVVDATSAGAARDYAADVAIIGTGAGGGTAAEILSDAGLRVIMIEEGPLRSSRDFHMLEREAYPQLYQESAGRRTKDKGIVILQGRSVGGSTTVNWTSSFRTPQPTLDYWYERYGLSDYTPEKLAPYFERMEQRLSIHPWNEPPNPNNAALARGAKTLGIDTAVIPRNVKGCYNLGYCGMGCPTNAKQSMLVTTIPRALDRGATLIVQSRAQRLHFDGAHAAMLECSPSIRVHARAFVVAGGAINSPALFLRSGAPDPYGTLGKRTFLHPVVISAAIMPEVIAGYAGAPQSIYSDHFMYTQPLDGPIGYKLEVPPVHPVLLATTTPGFGKTHAQLLAGMPHLQVIIALMRDGFHPDSPGGTVGLRSDGSPLLDYSITPYVWDGARRALKTMAQIQFAAGARTVLPVHEDARPVVTFAEAERMIDALPMEILRANVVSAHVMGGCGMGTDPRTSVVDGAGLHHQLDNVYVFDGSAFPTSIGANPQLSIYGMVARNAAGLAATLAKR
ncbi:MAG: GMC family oxidoreductase [Candidatus Aquilonibacter sp.]